MVGPAGRCRRIADPVTEKESIKRCGQQKLFAEAFLEGKPRRIRSEMREDFGGELRRASQMRRRFLLETSGQRPFTERIESHSRADTAASRKCLAIWLPAEQGYVGLKKKTCATRAATDLIFQKDKTAEA
jgi:hypothetical protein